MAEMRMIAGERDRVRDAMTLAWIWSAGATACAGLIVGLQPFVAVHWMWLVAVPMLVNMLCLVATRAMIFGGGITLPPRGLALPLLAWVALWAVIAAGVYGDWFAEPFAWLLSALKF